MTSLNIMKTAEFDDSIYYRAACACGADEHDVTIEFEKDQHTTMLFLNFYKTIAWCSHWGNELNWFQRIWKRISASFKMLFTGYIDLEESFILTEKSIEPFIKALIEGEEYMKKTKRKIRVKKKTKKFGTQIKLFLG